MIGSDGQLYIAISGYNCGGDLAEALSKQVEGLLKSPAELAELFGSKGITETSNIVVYDGGSQKYSSRIYWTLKYLGASNVKLLHKDMDMFKKSRVLLQKNDSYGRSG